MTLAGTLFTDETIHVNNRRVNLVVRREYGLDLTEIIEKTGLIDYNAIMDERRRSKAEDDVKPASIPLPSQQAARGGFPLCVIKQHGSAWDVLRASRTLLVGAVFASLIIPRRGPLIQP